MKYKKFDLVFIRIVAYDSNFDLGWDTPPDFDLELKLIGIGLFSPKFQSIGLVWTSNLFFFVTCSCL